jgi:N-acetylglutamate synthase-like GNAT family acetyltransferase
MKTTTGLLEKTEIVPARPEDMNFILLMAQKDRLDTRNASYRDFLVAKAEGNIIGFGRLKRHGTFVEMGTFDVLREYRGQGVGHLLMNHLLEKANDDVYLLTTIPDYAYRFNFSMLAKVPHYVQQQFDDCEKANHPNKVYVLLRKAAATYCEGAPPLITLKEQPASCCIIPDKDQCSL